MIITQVPKDIRKFKPKFISIFTKRQFFTILIAVIVDFAAYIFLVENGNMTLSSLKWPGLILNVMIIAFGYVEPYNGNIKPEKFVIDAIRIFTSASVKKTASLDLSPINKKSQLNEKKYRKKLAKIEKKDPSFHPYN